MGGGILKTNPTIRIGLIGCGTITYWQHLPSLLRMPDVRISGLADPDPSSLSRSMKLANAPGYADAHELLRQSDVDAVVIASPTGRHIDHLQAVIEAGKHAYVEKPAGHDAEALKRLAILARARECITAVGYNNRFHPGCQTLQRAVDSGRIGEVRAVISHFTEPHASGQCGWRSERRLGGGVLLDLATHHIDFYQWLTGDGLNSIHARLQTRNGEQFGASIFGNTHQGVEFAGYFSYGASRSHAATVHGSKGVLRLDLHAGLITLQRNRRQGYGVRRGLLQRGPRSWAWRLRKMVQPSYDPSHRLALSAFIDAIRPGSPRHPDLATLEDGVSALEVFQAAEASDLAS